MAILWIGAAATRVALALLSALLLHGGARPVPMACAQSIQAAPLRSPQVISDTLQPATSLFVCRVDGVGTRTNTLDAGTRSVTPVGLALLVVARWLHYAGYALGFGTLTFSLLAALAIAEPAMMMRVWRMVRVGIVLLLCAEPLALLAQTIGVRNTLFDLDVAGDVLASGFGLVWAQRVGVALLLWVVIGVINDGTRQAIWAVPILGLLLAIVDGAAGATGARLPFIIITAAAVHEAAMGVWIGGLAVMSGLWQTLERHERDRLFARFGWLSAAAIGALGITGVALAATRLSQPDALVTTLYGAVFSLKLLVALVAIVLALIGWRAFTLWRWRATFITLTIVLGTASLLMSVPVP